MRLVLKLIAAPFVVLLTVLVAVLLFLFSLSSFLLTAASVINGSAGRGTVLHRLPGGRCHLSGDCVPAFPLWLAGGDRSCYHGAGQFEPFFAPVYHKLTTSGQFGPK